jgi:hypothetical protein
MGTENAQGVHAKDKSDATSFLYALRDRVATPLQHAVHLIDP